MTSHSLAAPRPFGDVVVLAGAFAAGVAVRTALAGAAGAASLTAGLVFAAILGAFAVALRAAPGLSARSLAVGVMGAVALVVPALLVHGDVGMRGSGGYAGWAAATTLVATSEEMFLRGALFAALARWRGSDVAVVGAAVAFALLHVPLYGWHAVPLDLAVGLVLGALRLYTGGWAAPAVAHVGADLAGWWLT